MKSALPEKPIAENGAIAIFFFRGVKPLNLFSEKNAIDFQEFGKYIVSIFFIPDSGKVCQNRQVLYYFAASKSAKI